MSEHIWNGVDDYIVGELIPDDPVMDQVLDRKPNNPNYLDWAMRLLKPGTIIICDNVIRNGAVLNTDNADANVVGARAAFSFLGGDDRLDGSAIQTVGAKGYDGFAIALVS